MNALEREAIKILMGNFNSFLINAIIPKCRIRLGAAKEHMEIANQKLEQEIMLLRAILPRYQKNKTGHSEATIHGKCGNRRKRLFGTCRMVPQ